MKSFANMHYIKVLIKNNQKNIYVDTAVTVFSNYFSNLKESPFFLPLLVYRLYEVPQHRAEVSQGRGEERHCTRS